MRCLFALLLLFATLSSWAQKVPLFKHPTHGVHTAEYASSDDGKTLALVVDAKPGYRYEQLFIVDINNGSVEPVELFPVVQGLGPTQFSKLTFSPDGRYLAFRACPGKFCSDDLFVFDLLTRSWKKLTKGLERIDRDYDFEFMAHKPELNFVFHDGSSLRLGRYDLVHQRREELDFPWPISELDPNFSFLDRRGHLLYRTAGGGLVVWKLQDSNSPGSDQRLDLRFPSEDGPFAAGLSYDGRYLVSLTGESGRDYRGEWELYDLRTGRAINFSELGLKNVGMVWSATFAFDAPLLAVGDNWGVMQVVDYESKTSQVVNLGGVMGRDPREYQSIQFSAEGEFLSFTSKFRGQTKKKLHLFDLVQGQKVDCHPPLQRNQRVEEHLFVPQDHHLFYSVEDMYLFSKEFHLFDRKNSLHFKLIDKQGRLDLDKLREVLGD